MKTMLGKLMGFAVVALVLTACGSNNSTTTANGVSCSNGVCTSIYGSQTGSSSVANGTISFTANGAQVSLDMTRILAGQFPYQTGLGNYGQVSVGSSYGTGGGQVQFAAKQGSYGTLTMVASQGTVSGTIQLNQQFQQQILQSFGQNAQITSLAIWSTQYVQQTSYSTYTGAIAQALVYLYVTGNGGVSQPVGPVVF